MSVIFLHGLHMTRTAALDSLAANDKYFRMHFVDMLLFEQHIRLVGVLDSQSANLEPCVNIASNNSQLIRYPDENRFSPNNTDRS